MTKKKHRSSVPRELVLEEAGVRHVGTYTVDHGSVVVWYRGEKKARPVGHSPGHAIARQLLHELVTAAAERTRRH
jgi:hypothetical protein